VLSDADTMDSDIQAQLAIFRTLVVTVQHFFGGFGRLFHALTDHRDPTHITYQLQTLMTTEVLMFLLRLFACRQITHLLRAP